MSERVSGVVALAPEPAAGLVAALAAAGHDLEASARRARRVLVEADRHSGAPALLEDVARWSHRVAGELAERIDRVVRLDVGAPARPGATGPGERYLDVRGIADVDALLAALVALGVLAGSPPPGDVAARRTATGRLDPRLLRRLADHVPEAVGDADGLPFAVRDRANRRRLRAHIERLEGRGRALGDTDRRVLALLRDWRDDPGLQLVKLDVERGRVVVARGNLDTAGHVAAIVPGAGLTLDGIAARHAGWLDGLHDEMGRQLAADGRGGGAATVLWLDYDAPPRLVPDAVRASAAADAARRLPAFLEAVAGSGPRLVTVVGHSYGTVVLGRSLAEEPGGLAADQLLALGSPGLGVHRAKELGMRADQRLLAATFEEDPIARLGRWDLLAGPLGRAVHGPDPRLLEGVETVALSTHDLDDVEPLARHVQYLDDDSSALRVVAGLAAGTGRRPAGRGGPPAP